MFTKRHEEELAEIKALTVELGQRFDEILAELTEIRQAQSRLEKADPDARPGKRKAARAAKAAAAKGAKPGGGGAKARRPKKDAGLLAGQATADHGKPAKRARAAATGERKRRQAASGASSPGSDQE
jgi:hypothetical protein